MEVQYISLNMTPSGVNPIFHISQYDVGRLLGFYVYNGSEVVDLDDYTCTVEATRTDGTQITTNVITNNNSGIFAVTATMSNVADKYNCQLVIVDRNTNRVASLPFIMDVVTAALNGNDSSIYNNRTLYQQYNASMQAALANEANNRINADNLEKATRQSAVNKLQNNINAEATARQTADNTLQGNINSEASTRASTDSNLQSQINQLIAPSGEAPSAAEVQNARIGADGVTYDTLGTAIRTQVNNLKEDIDDFVGILNTSSIDTELKIKDSVPSKIRGFSLYGESIQKGVPSQTSEAPITSVGEKGNVNINISSEKDSYAVSIPLSEPLRSVGNVKDILEYNSNGSGRITRNVYYKVFKGNGEYWGKRNDITDIDAFVLASYKAGLLKKSSTPLSSHFIGVGNAVGDIGVVRVVDVDGYGLQFNVEKNKFADVNEWKNWLSQNNVTVLAERNVPIIEELTEEQVKKFNEISMYDDTTIKTDYDNDISIKYIANTKKYIDNKEKQKNILFFDDFKSFNNDIWKSCELQKPSSENLNRYRITENNLFVENSVLVLKCCKDSNGEYAAPYITTADSFAFRKGKISAKIKFGDYDTTLFTEGGGFWTFGQGGDWPNPFEFDIIELIYGKPPMYTVHYKYNGRNTERAFALNVDVTKWHIYSLEITDNHVIYYIDNKIINKYRISGFNADGKINQQDIRLMVKMNPESVKKEFYMFVDWVKVEDDEYIPTQNITHQDINLDINDVYVVEPTFYPANASNKAFTMESSNSNIVEIHKYENDVEYSFVANKIKALQSGTSKITLKTSNGFVCGEFTVTVN